MPYLYGPFNADGTLYDPPQTNSYKELIKNFPPCKPGVSYACIYCGKCPHGDYFKWPEIALPILEAQKKVVEEYHKEHGSSIDSMYFETNPNFEYLDGEHLITDGYNPLNG